MRKHSRGKEKEELPIPFSSRRVDKSHVSTNPFHPKGTLHLISPYKISPESNIKITRIKEMVTN